MNNLTERITRHPFFRDMKTEHLAVLTVGAKEMKFAPGRLLCREGTPANQFYLLESGSVALETHEPAEVNRTVQYIAGGDVLGWSWLFPPFVWHFQARAVEPTAAIALSGAHLLVTAEQDHEFGYELMKRVAQVLIHRLQATRKQMLESPVAAACPPGDLRQ